MFWIKGDIWERFEYLFEEWYEKEIANVMQCAHGAFLYLLINIIADH